MLCSNANNSQKNFVPICCSLWLPKCAADTTVKPVHPYRTSPFCIPGSKKLIGQVASRSGNAYMFLIENSCFMEVVCSNVNVNSKNNKYCFLSEFTLAVHQVFRMSLQSKSVVI